MYEHRVNVLLQEKMEYFQECVSSCHCDDPVCVSNIQSEYDVLISCLKEADACLPRHKPGVEKDWWTDNLTRLKNQSIEIHCLWNDQGRPRQGPVQDERLRVRACYRRAMRAAQRAPKQAAWDRLHSSLASKDTNSFWKSWKSLYNKNNCPLAQVVNGCSSKQDIANVFKASFQKNCTPNNEEKVTELNDKFSSAYEAYKSNHSASCNCNSYKVSLSNVIDSLGAMKCGKCPDEDGIAAEHFLNAPLSLLKRFTRLFNSMLKHASVPKQFQLGCMVPILKDHQGNHADETNYRGITISAIASKLLEHVLKIVFIDFLKTSEHQFGFKRNSSTAHALHCLKQTVNYYVNNGSKVFCCFLDASKAFDRVVHAGLFLKLIQRKIPLIFLDLIITWYGALFCRVKWGDSFSEWFFVTAGVRQGGVLSPDFYSIYVDDLIQKIILLGVGCYFLSIFAAALFYADDMAILAPSIKGLKKILTICYEYCVEWDVCLNAKKSKIVPFGKKVDTVQDVVLDGNKIEMVKEWVYLGVTLKSDSTFNCSVSDRIKKFYKCANAIFRIDGHSNDTVMLHLIETHCVPLLTYGIEIVHVKNRDERRQLRVAYNSVFRKIFGYRWSESVTALQSFLGRPTWEQLVEKRQTGFHSRVANHFLANALLNV